MPPFSDQPATRAPSAGGNTTTLTCPGCNTTLQTAADRSVEAPCPLCGHLLRYEAPLRAKLAPFQPLRRHSRRSAPEKRSESGTRRTRRVPLSRGLHRANEFLNSRPGMLAACAVLCLLLVLCAFLFFKWDQRRRAKALRDRSPAPIETVRPAPANPVVPVNLPPVEQPDPVPDPFALPPEQVIEAGKPEE